MMASVLTMSCQCVQVLGPDVDLDVDLDADMDVDDELSVCVGIGT